MKKGFTILELLVASLLLGMLVTIVTMIINQSSISWRTGLAMVADLDEVRDNMGELREEADNAFVYKMNGQRQIFRYTGLWKKDGTFYDRACDAPNSTTQSDDGNRWQANLLKDQVGTRLNPEQSAWSGTANMLMVGAGQGDGSGKAYIVNVMSAGPDREFDTWDDVWSFPDDFE